MKVKLLLSILTFYFISIAYEMQIREAFNEGCKDGWLRDVYSIYGAYYLVQHFTKLNISKTEEEIEYILLKIAEEELEEYESNKSHDTKLLRCISRILLTSESMLPDSFLKKLYKTGNPGFMEMTLKYMITRSDEWFICAKEIIDNIPIVNSNMIRYNLYHHLKERLQNSSDDTDSLKNLIYNALTKEHWGNVIRLDSIYSSIEPEYIGSKQRLNILSRVDNDTVKLLIERRRDKLKERKDYKTYEDLEIALKTYKKMKKEKKLKDYIPPVLNKKQPENQGSGK